VTGDVQLSRLRPRRRLPIARVPDPDACAPSDGANRANGATEIGNFAGGASEKGPVKEAAAFAHAVVDEDVGPREERRALLQDLARDRVAADLDGPHRVLDPQLPLLEGR
jgi:hypothetical protein